MASTSTITKSNTRKEPSGAEKKKNKLKKEFFANLTIATPEDKEKEVLKNERKYKLYSNSQNKFGEFYKSAEFA